ncbi:MAG: NifU family protein [Deltaproteobacteria bacterium]|nr:NifU family protein [Deltaproteobacteria bacterium]
MAADSPPFPADELLREYLQNQILPLLAIDRGCVELRKADPVTARVVLRYSGTCAGCPGLTVTHERLVAPLLRRTFPAIVEVEASIDGERRPSEGPSTPE